MNKVEFPLRGLENEKELFIIYAAANKPPKWMIDAVYTLLGWPTEPEGEQ